MLFLKRLKYLLFYWYLLNDFRNDSILISFKCILFTRIRAARNYSLETTAMYCGDNSFPSIVININYFLFYKCHDFRKGRLIFRRQGMCTLAAVPVRRSPVAGF